MSKAPPSAEAVTERQLNRLPPRASLALAARAAWRALPASSGAHAEALGEAGAALALAELVASGRDPDSDLVARIAERSPAARKGGDPALGVMFGAARTALEVLRASQAEGRGEGAVAASAVATHEAAVAALEGMGGTELGAAATQAAGDDLAWLRGWSAEKRAADGIVGSDFFGRPLWERPEGREPPKAWVVLLEQWAGEARAADLAWLAESERAMVGGADPDWRGLGGYLEEWSAAAGEEKVEEQVGASDQSGERPERPGDETGRPEASIPLEGGIVTAAADTPALVDRLGRRPLVETLADMLASPQQALPMTIALLGDWGAGKSSVIAQLRLRLVQLAREEDRARYLFAEFNAWEYEQTDNLRAGLAQEVVNGLTAGLGRWRKLILALRKAHRDSFLELWQSLAGLALAVVGIALGVNLATPDEVGVTLERFDLIGGTGLAGLGVYLLLQAWRSGKRLLEHPLASQLRTYLQLPSYGRHLGEVPVIRRDIASLCEERLRDLPRGRLLVIVDDLDRCHHQAISETLDAIRLVVNLERVAVIIAIDDRIAFRAVAEHYRDLAQDGARTKEEIARDYLGKIIQLPVNLYEPWPWEVAGFIREHLFDVDAPDAPTAAEPMGAPGPEVDTVALSPAARTLIEAQGLDPRAIRGSGQGGRIVKADVLAYLKERPSERPGVEGATPAVGSPAGSAPPAASAEMEPEGSEVLMRDTVFERELFARLAQDLGAHNPRQLIRLKNSYRLLKGYRHRRSRGELSTRLVEQLMHGLFWYEHLYQQGRAERERAELIAWEWGRHPEWWKLAGGRPDNPPAVNMARQLWALLPEEHWDEEYRRLMRTVEMVVLPNAQMGLILSRAHARRLIEALGHEPRPWG